MQLTRTQFFLLSFSVLFSLFFAQKIIWLARANRAKGRVVMTGHGNFGSVIGLSTYQVIKYVVNTDTIVFNGDMDLGLVEGSQVSILYQPGQPYDAKVSQFKALFGDSLVYFIGPLLVLIIIFLTPGLIPKHSQIAIGWRGLKILEKK